MKTVSSTDLKQSLGHALAAAAVGPVAITRHGTPRYVLMSVEEFARRNAPSTRKVYSVYDTPDDLALMLEEALSRQLTDLE